MGFLSWDLPFNAKRNGVYYHILQTGVKRSVPKPDRVEMEALTKFTATLSVNGDFHRPRKIIFILCESCWYDESHFRDVFEPLLSIDFQPFRALSPVYGAGTANSEFEFLTGLSSYSSVLTGIVYQGYANDFRNTSESLPRALSRVGYLSFSLHNNSASFWQRNIVYKKLGFHHFFSLEDMKSI